MFGGGSLTVTASKQRKGWIMKEYKVLTIREDVCDNERNWNVNWASIKGQEDILNYYAQKGWQLISAVPNVTGSGAGDGFYLYLERPAT